MQGQSPRYADQGPISQSVEGRDWRAARLALAEKLAKLADATDSARDAKSIARELAALLDRCEADQHAADVRERDTPLARILADTEGGTREAV